MWLAALVAASLTAPLWLPFKTEDQDFTAVLSGPTAAHWLGTDELGRDILSRIFASAAGTLGTSLITVIVAVGLGTLLAMAAAAAGERVEDVISRVTEIMMSLPGTVIILAVIGAVGTNIPLIMAILGILISAGIYRVMLGQAKSLQSQLYVDAAKVDGVSLAGHQPAARPARPDQHHRGAVSPDLRRRHARSRPAWRSSASARPSRSPAGAA